MIGRLPGTDGHDGRDELVRAWEVVLAALEADVLVAERMLTGPHDVAAVATAAGTWLPPQVSGPLPESLLGRAHDLLRRHAAVRDGLSRALDRSRADLAQLRPASPGGVPSAAYVDISA